MVAVRREIIREIGVASLPSDLHLFEMLVHCAVCALTLAMTSAGRKRLARMVDHEQLNERETPRLSANKSNGRRFC
jgi:hypothetical protein